MEGRSRVDWEAGGGRGYNASALGQGSALLSVEPRLGWGTKIRVKKKS